MDKEKDKRSGKGRATIESRIKFSGKGSWRLRPEDKLLRAQLSEQVKSITTQLEDKRTLCTKLDGAKVWVKWRESAVSRLEAQLKEVQGQLADARVEAEKSQAHLKEVESEYNDLLRHADGKLALTPNDVTCRHFWS